MLSALLYLRAMSVANWARARLRRLKQPKYLAGAIVGFAYFYFFFFRHITRPDPSAGARRLGTGHALPAVVSLPSDSLPLAAGLGALLLLVILTLLWVVPARRAALGFSEAEIAFLFPAPVTRRALIHFRLLSAQFRNLAGAIVMMLFSNRWTFLGGNALTHAVGWWFIFSALNLHYSGANFTLTRLGDLGLAAWRRRLLALALVAAVIATAWFRLPAEARLTSLSNDLSLGTMAKTFATFTQIAPLGWLLWPLKLILGPFLAADTRQFLLALAPALAVVVLHYLWVVQTAVSFEDASIEYAQKRSARIAAWRAGDHRLGRGTSKGRPAPFPLAGEGTPELAFLWKNLLSTWPYFTPRVFAITAFVIAAVCAWLGAQPAGRGVLDGVGFVAVVLSGYLLIVGPQFARQDIRSDLPNADILKTYPLAGWQIVLGELLTPTAILTGILWLALLLIALAVHPTGRYAFSWLTPESRLVATLGIAVVIPALVALQLLVPTAATLLFPGWFQATRSRGGGPEVVGQRMIFFFAQLLTFLVALLPAALMAVVLLLVVKWLAGLLLAIGMACLAVSVVLVVEVWAGVWWLGRVFERLDLSAELRP